MEMLRVPWSSSLENAKIKDRNLVVVCFKAPMGFQLEIYLVFPLEFRVQFRFGTGCILRTEHILYAPYTETVQRILNLAQGSLQTIEKMFTVYKIAHHRGVHQPEGRECPQRPLSDIMDPVSSESLGIQYMTTK